VRAIAPRVVHGYDEDGLLLAEIVNPVLTIKSGTGTRESELAFRMSRFRPLRATNIDVFLDMLEPVPAEAAVRYDMAVPLGFVPMFIGFAPQKPENASPARRQRPGWLGAILGLIKRCRPS
jgi:hypothetical protein